MLKESPGSQSFIGLRILAAALLINFTLGFICATKGINQGFNEGVNEILSSCMIVNCMSLNISMSDSYWQYKHSVIHQGFVSCVVQVPVAKHSLP